MLQLLDINFEEFETTIYTHYVELFPEDERKALKNLKSLYEKN